MIDKIRTTLHDALESPRGDAVTGGARAQDPRAQAEQVFGDPLCSSSDSTSARAVLAKLETTKDVVQTKLERDGCPRRRILEKDRNQRVLDRVEELLKSRSIAYRTLDVTGDEAASRSSCARRNAKRTICRSCTSRDAGRWIQRAGRLGRVGQARRGRVGPELRSTS